MIEKSKISLSLSVSLLANMVYKHSTTLLL